MPILPGTRRRKTWEGAYDFAIDGGAQSTITLRSTDGPIPNGAVIEGGYLDVTVACLSGTGTIALQANAAADILAAAAQAALTIGIKTIIPAATGATMVKLTADRNPAMVIATAAFTAGVFKLVLFYR
jgi:hypothetical protein